MSERLIDELARGMASGLPRRRLLRGLVLGLGLPVLSGRGVAAAGGCKRVGGPCERNANCCAGARCQDGLCECRPGHAECDLRCYVLETDRRHCGACGNACPQHGGDPSQWHYCCGGTCVHLASDPDHCGACFLDCAANESCVDGRCV